jgi:hypothetical protein
MSRTGWPPHVDVALISGGILVVALGVPELSTTDGFSRVFVADFVAAGLSLAVAGILGLRSRARERHRSG